MGKSLAEMAERVGRALPEGPHTHILCVSGGLDSMALLHVYGLLWKSGMFKNEPVVFHLDHRLRTESGTDADFVCEAARASGFPVYLEARDVKGFARRVKVGLEEAGRELRYRILDRLVARLGTPATPAIVVTAHHADDYIESLLIHLIRGGGQAALSTLPLFGVVKGQPRFRPLVMFDRQEIESAMEGLPFRNDSSNSSREHLRNRVRQDLLPALRREGLSSTRLWENFHDAEAFIPAHAPVFHIELDRGLLHGSSLQQIKSILDVAMDRMHLPPASRSLVQSIQEKSRSPRFRLRLETGTLKIWSDQRGPVHFFKSDSPWFKPMGLYGEGPEITVSYAEQTLSIRLGAGESLVCFSAGLKYRTAGQTRKIKKLFQELGVPSVIRPFVPIVVDSDNFAVRVCLSFFEGADLFFYNDVRKELTVNPASM
ncbi:MAG: tRNA lysidine(34) synthetase TilS [Spirochaetia bacterium]|nr:tRNA lysidine(34) synthetase TilS [Spirochaetia bacterium]